MGLWTKGRFQQSGLSVSWLSNFTGEDEVLFIGGYKKIRLNTIINVKTKENFKKMMKIFFMFDCMISGRHLSGYEWGKVSYAGESGHKEEHRVLKSLIDQKINNDKFVCNYSKYANYTFSKLMDNKKTIILHCSIIDSDFNGLSDLLFARMEMLIYISSEKLRRPKLWEFCKIDPILFKLFKNISQVIIYINSYPRPDFLFPLNLLFLLEVLTSSSHIIKQGLKIIINQHLRPGKTKVPMCMCLTPEQSLDDVEAKYCENGWAFRVNKTRRIYPYYPLLQIVLTKT